MQVRPKTTDSEFNVPNSPHDTCKILYEIIQYIDITHWWIRYTKGYSVWRSGSSDITQPYVACVTPIWQFMMTNLIVISTHHKTRQYIMHRIYHKFHVLGYLREVFSLQHTLVITLPLSLMYPSHHSSLLVHQRKSPPRLIIVSMWSKASCNGNKFHHFKAE